MAPSFDNLKQNGYEDDEEQDIEEEIDFSDLNEQYEVRLEEGLDTFVVIDGLPIVSEDARPKLVKFILKKMKTVGDTSEDAFYMPMNDQGMSDGYAFVEYRTPDQANQAIKALNSTPLDKRHTMFVNKLTDIDRYGREGKVNEEYEPPEIEPFREKEHLRWWLGDPEGRDQFIMFSSDNVGVYWNERKEKPKEIVDRQNWTESFVQWSPMGTFLTSMHSRGVILWGGPSWGRLKRLMHPGVNLIDFSPDEQYLTTWSHKPIQVEEENGMLSAEDEGKNYVIWDIATGKPLRSFANIDQSSGVDEEGRPVKKKMNWPAFKWSSDAKYVARMIQGQSISIYELPKMVLLDKTSIKIEGVVDFEWAPATPQRDGIRTYEQLFCFWTPEIGSNPAKVGLMSIPSKDIVRTRNLFNVSDAKLHWQSQAAFVCVKVDRHSKSKKTLATNLEIFRVREKGVPVEVVDSIKDPVINFAWEPKGDRFVLITVGEIMMNTAVPPKTSVSFFCPEKGQGVRAGNFRHIRTLEKRNSNAIYWSPKGRFVVVATVSSQQSNELDFYDLDYEGEKDENEKDLSANLQLMSTADHYGVTDVEWDPTGRYVGTSASMWKHAMESGYHIHSFRGSLLREEHIDRFKQFSWRPRPPTMLSKDEQKTVRRNLRDYSKIFEEQDTLRENKASQEVVDERRRLLREWIEFREEAKQGLRDLRLDRGLAADAREEEEEARRRDGRQKKEEEEDKVVEEIVEEIIRETEEVV